MNKTLGLVALCLGAAAVGGFVALRFVGQQRSFRDAPTPTSSLSTTPVISPGKASPVAGGPVDLAANSLVATPSAQASVGAQDTYNFESLSGSKDKLEAHFASEGRDSNWAPNATDTVNYELQALPVYSKLTSVDIDCRATLCRIESTMPIEMLEATQNNHTGWVEAMSNLASVPPWSTAFDNSTDIVSYENQLGQARLTTYLHRRPQGAVTYARNAS